MRKTHNSLILKIALPFALLLVLTMGGLSLYLSSFLRDSYLNLMRANLIAETRLVADRMAVLMTSNSETGALEERARLYSGLLGTRVTIIDPNGVVLAETSTNPQEMENHLNRPEVQQALKNQVASEIRYSKTIRTEMLYAAAPMMADSKLIGIARLSIALDAINLAESRLLNTVVIASAVAAAIAMLVAVIIAAYAVRPIQELTRTAQGVADGKIDEIATTFRADEIGQLHQSIQLMARRLTSQITDLHIERGKLEAVLANMTDGVIIVNSEGGVELINPAAKRLFLASEESASSKSLVEVVRNHQLVEIWRRCRQTGEQQTTTLETTPDRLFVQGIATPLDDSLPGMTLLVFQDLTRVRRLETVRRDFVSNVSHELRTPLASLKALTETLQEGALDDPPAARRFLQRMDTEIDNLTQMVHELLELSRIESNKVPLQRVPVTACDLAIPAVERMQLQAERAGLKLQMDCPDNLPLVKADPERIEQVLVNLIHNAIKFTLPGGEIRLSATANENAVTFAIHDTGVGISPEVLPRIFERFYKVDRSRSSGGTGLGLSIARHIIESHGGRIWAESKPGEGSTFFFTLPLN
ncbi:MAG TPA: ATP-binding protein [Anaerolineaceae bacterium]